MKKNVFIMALAAMALFSTTAFAQVPDDMTPPPPMDGRPAMQGQRSNPFEGIELTADQQQALQSLRQQRHEAMKQQQADAPESRRQAMKEEQKAYLESIKGILTADQYVQFLENSYINQSPMMQRGGQHGGGQRPPRPAAD